MRVMQHVIWNNDLLGEYGNALIGAPGYPQDWWPGPDSDSADEASDVEDPEKTAKDDLKAYKEEVREKEHFFQMAVVETAQRASEGSQVHLDMERARMELEDLRGQLLRATPI